MLKNQLAAGVLPGGKVKFEADGFTPSAGGARHTVSPAPKQGMTQTSADRRKGRRVFLGLPGKARVADRADPLTVELMDVSASGSRLEVHGDAATVHVHDRMALGFVVPGWPKCQAKGQVVRVERAKHFALVLDDTNEAFDAFIRLVASRR